MAVQPQTPFKEYTANGTTTVFPLGFDCKDKDHLIVMIDDAETDNSTWSLNDDHVIFNVAPAADKKITLQRNTPYRRDRNYQAYDNSFRPGPVNDDFDWIWWKLQELGVADWILGNRINALKNYVDRKDDELKAYLMEEIRKQGVALDQLDEYYNYLMERLAQIAVDKGWDASFVVDGDETQHEINNKIRASTGSNVINFFTAVELKNWLNDPEVFDVSDILIRFQSLSSGSEMIFPDGTFRITKQIPSTKAWRGVRGSFQTRGTRVIVDNPVAIDPVILCDSATGAIDLLGIYFEDKQRLKHTLLKENTYQGVYKGLRIDRFNVGIQTSGTYSYWSDCYFMGNNKGVKITPTANTGNANSTMFGFTECFFIYNDVGVDVVGVGAGEDLINVPFVSCGFELNRIGLNSPNRTWYMTLLNCWFEANSTYGINAPTTHLVEINTRHNANSPKNISPTEASLFLGMEANMGHLKSLKFETNEVVSDLNFSPINEDFKTGNSIKQEIVDSGGKASAQVKFLRRVAHDGYGAISLLFSTSPSTTSSKSIDRWEITPFGDLVPVLDLGYNIGNPEHKIAAIYTAKTMYTEKVGDFYGEGSPEGRVMANPGSTYRRIDLLSGPRFYIKESGEDAEGWVAK